MVQDLFLFVRLLKVILFHIKPMILVVLLCSCFNSSLNGLRIVSVCVVERVNLFLALWVFVFVCVCMFV